jgi:4-hydroxy-tetrahydrodipicolinate reductase
MNTIIAGMLLDKGVEIVGAIARSPEKVGRDLGDLIGIGRELGVIVSADAAAVFEATRPDIAVIAVNSYLTDAVVQLRICAEHGVNAVNPVRGDALYPWETSPELAAELDALAKSTGATLTGSGFQDTFWVNMVALLMVPRTGSTPSAARRAGMSMTSDPSWPPHNRWAAPSAQFDEWDKGAQRPPTFGRNVLDALVADTGLTVRSITTSNPTPISPLRQCVRQHSASTWPPETWWGSPTSTASKPKRDRSFVFECRGGSTSRRG